MRTLHGGWRFGWVVVLSLVAVLAFSLSGLATPQTPGPADVPVVKGGAGMCTADFVVTDASGKEIYDAKIEIQIRYRFGGFHRLDAKVGTNSDGKARVEGLPEQIKNTAEFTVSHGDLTKTVPYDPQADCHAHHEVTLAAK
jgi:hypothetical protein